MTKFNDDAANLLAFAQNQNATIIRQTFDPARDMADIVYNRFVPIVGGNPFASSVIFTSSKLAGKADFINGNADDVPLADSQSEVDTQMVYTAAIGYGWGWEELNMVRAMGGNLQADRAFAARRAYEEMIQRLVFDGDAQRGLVGLNGITDGADVSSEFTGKWAAGTADAAAIAKDLITLIRGTGRGNEPTANRVVLPADDYTHALTQFFANTGVTAIDLVKSQYPGLQITSRTALENVGGDHKYLAYRFDQTSLAFHLPMPLRFLPVYQSGPLRFEVPGVFRVGGLNVVREEDFAYAAKS